MDAVHFYVMSGLWAVVMIALLIAAIRLSYAIERRSGTRPGKSGLPSYANVLPVAFNIGVARDAQTQILRRRMNMLLLAILAGFVVFAGAVNWLLPEAGA